MRALFLDRDGVVNLDTGYTYKTSELSFVDGIIYLIKFFQNLSYRIVVVSNQSGIGRGYYRFNDWNKFNRAISAQLAHYDCRIDKFYCCPHLPASDQRTLICSCRKPKPGMFFDAKLEFKINLSESLLIGDKLTDIYAADNAGLDRAYLLSDRDYPVEKKIKINWMRVNSLRLVVEREKNLIR